jgi:hypothetical protein
MKVPKNVDNTGTALVRKANAGRFAEDVEETRRRGALPAPPDVSTGDA